MIIHWSVRLHTSEQPVYIHIKIQEVAEDVERILVKLDICNEKRLKTLKKKKEDKIKLYSKVVHWPVLSHLFAWSEVVLKLYLVPV